MELRHRGGKNPRAFSLQWMPCYQKLPPASGPRLGDFRRRCALPVPRANPSPWPCPCPWLVSEVGLHLEDLHGEGWMEAAYFLLFCINLFIDGVPTPSLRGHAAGGGLVLSHMEGGPALSSVQHQGLKPSSRPFLIQAPAPPHTQAPMKPGPFAGRVLCVAGTPPPHGTPVCRVWLCGLWLQGTPRTLWSALPDRTLPLIQTFGTMAWLLRVHILWPVF